MSDGAVHNAGMVHDESQVHQSPAYTDEEWNEWKDYADTVTIHVRFKSWAGAEANDESWTIETDGAAWSKDWLARQLVELAAADAGNSCCGRGNYMLDATDRKTEWGASGAGFEAVLTLSENLLSEATWVALGALAQTLRARLKAREPWPDGEPITEEEARNSAFWAVVRSRDVARGDLRVSSVEFVDHDTVLVELLDATSGTRFTVEMNGHHDCVRRCRVRKIVEPGDGP